MSDAAIVVIRVIPRYIRRALSNSIYTFHYSIQTVEFGNALYLFITYILSTFYASILCQNKEEKNNKLYLHISRVRTIRRAIAQQTTRSTAPLPLTRRFRLRRAADSELAIA